MILVRNGGLVVVAVLAVLAFAGVARGATAPDLVHQGEELAREGRFPEAIIVFKQAEQLAPDATDACLIGLAYLRAEQWSQADVFFGRCREQMPQGTGLPSWLPLAERELDEHLHVGRFAAVAIQIEPGDDATFGLSSFAPDEVFSPRTVRLAPGRYVITATAPGHPRVQTAIEVRDAAPRTVVFRIASSASAHPRIPWVVAGSGVALLIAGAIYQVVELAPVRATLADTKDPAVYDRSSPTFDHRRAVTLGLYGVGAAAVIAGIVLHYTVFRDHRESPVQISGELADHGAMVGIAWRR